MHDVLPEVGRISVSESIAVLVLGRDQDLLDLDRAPVLVADRDLGLAVGPQVGEHVALADLREAVRELVRERDRHAASAPAVSRVA